MNDLNGYKIAQIGGLALAVIFAILAYIGIYSMSLFIMYGVLILVGAGVFYGAGKLDEAERNRQLDEESRQRKLDRE